jgi:hypothetical protein
VIDADGKLGMMGADGSGGALEGLDFGPFDIHLDEGYGATRQVLIDAGGLDDAIGDGALLLDPGPVGLGLGGADEAQGRCHRPEPPVHAGDIPARGGVGPQFPVVARIRFEAVEVAVADSRRFAGLDEEIRRIPREGATIHVDLVLPHAQHK